MTIPFEKSESQAAPAHYYKIQQLEYLKNS